MNSAIDRVFLQNLRQTESTDARLGLGRPVSDEERKRRQGRDRHEGGDANPLDRASVSIEALRLFLQNLLRSSAERPAQRPLPPETQATIADETGVPVYASAAVAVKAYSHAAQAAPQPAAANPETENPAPEKTPLDGEDFRTIHRLLNDLASLAESGLESLTIERASSFLESLVNAVETARKNPES